MINGTSKKALDIFSLNVIVWFVTFRASVTSFFTAYDALCEEGLTSTVAKVLNDIADIYLSGVCQLSHEDFVLFTSFRIFSITCLGFF